MIGATYRLQMRGGVGFEQAAAIVPQLAAARITHLYVSPIFRAAAGSTHGYDVADHNELDPELGGEAGFARLCETLAAHGMGLLVDIVPNHMAASMDNPWWRDVAKHGERSPYARHFDIDWSAGRLVLPILGKPYGEALADGEIMRREADGEVVLSVPGADLPVAPGTESITDAHALHEAQAYRLTHWRLGRDGLTYRRFFEVTGLVGVRVEDPAVFDDVHRLILRLVGEGKVQGLRVDHVDGLSDPAATLTRLANAAQVPVVVEKILEPDERLRDWPIDGTTGYELISAMASLFVDGEGLKALSRHYGAIACDDIDAMTRAAKRTLLTQNLAGELERLAALAQGLFAEDLSARDHGRATIREGLVALMGGLHVYRSYLPSDDVADLEVIEDAQREADVGRLDDPRVVADLARLLTAPEPDAARREFIVRFQQTSGPLMAKAVEDTLFYRHHRLLALNEVGGSLDPTLGPERYLRVASAGGLAATQTHDTKRGEDSRARLYALSDPHAAALFDTVWRTMPEGLPDKLRWAFAQMAFAARPLRADPDFVDRFREACLKSVREAKEETSWTRTDAAFEARVAEAAEAIAARPQITDPLAEVARAGAVLSLSQQVLKMIGRPAPDIYQGTFGWDFSMVDPDNRRPVDFSAEAALCHRARTEPLGDLARDWRSGAVKARVVLEGLALRHRRGSEAAVVVHPVPLGGASADAFAAFRVDGSPSILAIVPTRPHGLLDAERLTFAPDKIALSATLDGTYEDVFTRTSLTLADLSPRLCEWPVILATHQG